MSSRRDAAPSEDGASTTGAHALSRLRPPATRGAARGLPAHTRRLKCKPRDARSRAHAAPIPAAASLHRLRLCKATAGEPGGRGACPRGRTVKTASAVTPGPLRRRPGFCAMPDGAHSRRRGWGHARRARRPSACTSDLTLRLRCRPRLRDRRLKGKARPHRRRPLRHPRAPLAPAWLRDASHGARPAAS